MKEDAEETRRIAEEQREETVRKRREEREELEERIVDSRNAAAGTDMKETGAYLVEISEDGSAPLIKTSENVVLFTGNGSVKFFINFPVSCINAAVADHLEMFFRDMPD